MSKVIWLYGLSGSGKTTLIDSVFKELIQSNEKVFILDGDRLREGLNRDLKFSAEDRKENLRRSAEVAKLFAQAGFVVLCTFITPLKENRELVREILQENVFLVYIDCSVEECENRDVKGLYAKARKGEIKDFTGISAPFEIFKDYDFSINTEQETLEKCKKVLLEKIQSEI